MSLYYNDQEFSDKEVTTAAGISRRAVAKAIAKLQAEGIIRRVGHDKGGHWKIVKKE